MAYRLLGSGTTNSDGKATYTYTGVGAGELDVVASLDNPIVSGSVQSEPYTLWDTLFYDDGVTDPKTVTWYNYANRLTIDIDENGTTLFRDASSGTGFYFTSQTGNLYSAPVVIEFDVVSYSANYGSGIDFASNNFTIDNNKQMRDLGISQGDSVKIVYDGTTIKVYRNGSTTPNEVPLSISGNFTFGFYVAPSQSLKYKNFKLYNG